MQGLPGATGGRVVRNKAEWPAENVVYTSQIARTFPLHYDCTVAVLLLHLVVDAGPGVGTGVGAVAWENNLTKLVWKDRGRVAILDGHRPSLHA